jgi:L-ascorbate metabolism protein UlaG (beta-lactamase superfamily)
LFSAIDTGGLPRVLVHREIAPSIITMNRKHFLSSLLLLGAGLHSKNLLSMPAANRLKIRLIRNATLFIEWNGTHILVDPLLSNKGALDPVPWSNDTRNPTVELPLTNTEVSDMLLQTDAVLLTHLHRDHWDIAAQQQVPKGIPVFCQPEDLTTLSGQGFTGVRVVEKESSFQEIRITRVPARHGHGELAEKMAPVSGYVLQSKGRTLYIAGDTVWYEGVAENIRKYDPDIIVVNSGAAQFNFGDPITMNEADVIATARAARRGATVVAVHLEAINHCGLKRDVLAGKIKEAGLSETCRIPRDGETILFS